MSLIGEPDFQQCTCSKPKSIIYRSHQQVDICPEELHNSVRAEVAILADIRLTMVQFSQMLSNTIRGWRLDANSPWWQELKLKCQANRQVLLSAYYVNQIDSVQAESVGVFSLNEWFLSSLPH